MVIWGCIQMCKVLVKSWWAWGLLSWLLQRVIAQKTHCLEPREPGLCRSVGERAQGGRGIPAISLSMSYFALWTSENYFVSSSRSAACTFWEERRGEGGGSGDTKKYSWHVIFKWSVTALATTSLTCPSAVLLISDSHCSGRVSVVGLLLEGLYLGLPKNFSELLFWYYLVMSLVQNTSSIARLTQSQVTLQALEYFHNAAVEIEI